MKKVKRYLCITFPKGWTWVGIGIASILWGYFVFNLFKFLFYGI